MSKKIPTIKVYSDSISEGTFRKINKKYKSLSEAQSLELASDLSMDLFMEEARKRVKEGKMTLVEFWDSETNQMIFKQKVVKQKGELLLDLETFQENVGLDDLQIQEALSVVQSDRILKEDEYFLHPLSESLDEEGEIINMYASASILINAIRNDSGKLSGNQAKSEEFFKKILFRLNPTLNTNKLIADIKMHRLSAMMKACNIFGTADISELKSN